MARFHTVWKLLARHGVAYKHKVLRTSHYILLVLAAVGHFPVSHESSLPNPSMNAACRWVGGLPSCRT